MRLGTFESGDQKPIGAGETKEVFVNPENTRRVISVLKEKKAQDYLEKKEKETPNKLKGTFYLTKITHLLLPDHVPDIYQAGESADGQQTFDRERVAHTPGHALLQEKLASGTGTKKAEKQMIKEMGTEMSEVTLKLENIGLGFNIDEDVANYTRSEQGNVHYLETFAPWKPRPGQPDELELLFDKEELTRAIEQLPDEHARKTCEEYLERLLTLFEEEQKAFKEMYRARLRDAGPEIRNIEILFTTFELKHNLELLLAIQTEKEAMESSERSAAKKDLSLILSQLQTLGTGTTITTEQLLELHKKYDTLSRAVGIISSGFVDHNRP